MPKEGPRMADGSRSRLLAKLLRGILVAHQFEELGDLVEALKRRCAGLRIGWTNDDINDALRLVASNRPLVDGDRHELRGRAARHHRKFVDGQMISKTEAAAILKRLGVTV
jgi:hypothetical protein